MEVRQWSEQGAEYLPVVLFHRGFAEYQLFWNRFFWLLFFAIIFGLVFITLAGDLFYFKLMDLSVKHFLLLLAILLFFLGWNVVALRVHALNGSSEFVLNPMLENGFENLLLILLLLLYFAGVGIAKRSAKKAE
ncbi:MAG: hypothetical protein IPL49_10470 [Saprospirales bacterium]|nr:hypothetical protein [Saprospirales bacterium]